MKIIFLDIDGVLNFMGSKAVLPGGSYFVDDSKLKILKQIVDATGADLVLSSSWRRGWSLSVGDSKVNRFSVEQSKDYFMFCAKLHDFGLSLLSEIPRLPDGNREDAVNYWLREWPGESIREYVILDDEADKFYENNSHLIVTSMERGLEPSHAKEAIRILTSSSKSPTSMPKRHK